MKDVGKMIRELRLRRGWTLRRLGEAIGKTPAYLSIIENNRRRIRRPLLEDIARALGVDISYFLGPQEEPGGKSNILKDLRELIDRHSDAGGPAPAGRRVPILSDIAAGEPLSRDDPFPVGVADEYIEVPADVTDPHAFGLRIKGDSMEPRLFEGDVVVVCPSWKVRKNRPVVAKVRGDEVTCKLFSRTDTMVVLTSINPKYPPQIYRESEIVWIYPVARAISNLYT
jgi:repressor LexA